MSPEILTIIGVGIALATVMIAGLNRLDKRIDHLENRIEHRMDALEQRVAGVEGLMLGIREALFDRMVR